jgi:hypothetical protein
MFLCLWDSSLVQVTFTSCLICVSSHFMTVLLSSPYNCAVRTASLLNKEPSNGHAAMKCCIVYRDSCTVFLSEGQPSQSEREYLRSVGCPWTLPPASHRSLPAKLKRTAPSSKITSFPLYLLLFLFIFSISVLSVFSTWTAESALHVISLKKQV